jgi:formylglycine-generating enzyme required for sulfatase activity
MRLLPLVVAAVAAVPLLAQLWVPPKDDTKTTTNATGMEVVLVAAGEFQMGCSVDDRECGSDEKPVHTVKIGKPFYIGKYEVTQGQWEAMMGGKPSYFNESRVGANWKAYPVEQVSWNAVHEFLAKLSASENGRKYRLPTEAEWEYAARAGTADAHQGGAADSVGWSWSNSGGNTHEVGQSNPNAWGIYDMLGNVWEWVEDGYDDKYYKTSPNTDPPGPEGDETTHRSLLHPLGGGSVLHPLRKDVPRVIRGSSWYWNVKNMRVSARRSYKQDYSDYAGGFRVAADAQ